MANNTFSSFFGGTMGIITAILFVVIGLPILACGGCLALGTLGTFGAMGAASSLPEPSNNKEDSTSSATSTSPQTPTPKPAPQTKKASKTETSKVFYVGDTVHVGNVSYMAEKGWWSNTLSSNQFLNHPPDAAYLFVQILIRNDDTQSRVVPPFQLVDENNATYSPSERGWAIEGSLGILTSINPGVTKRGTIVFDVPKGRSYRLKLSGGYLSTETSFIQLTDMEKERKAAEIAEKRAQEEQEKAAAEKAEAEARDTKRLEDIENRKIRTWTSADGKFKTEAKYVSMTNGKVKLLRISDGKEITVESSVLCDEDLNFIRNKSWLKEAD